MPRPPSYIRIALCDDHSVFVQGLAELLNDTVEFKVVLKAYDGLTLLEKLKGRSVDILLLDLNMPQMKGVEVIQHVSKRFPDIKVIILSMDKEDHYITHAIELGACAYLFKEATLAEIRKTLLAVHQNGSFFTPGISEAMARGLESKRKKRPQLDAELQLNENELTILRMLADGHNNAEIADHLFLAKRTIEGIRTRLLEKAKVKTTASLIAFAYRNGFLK